MLTTIYWESFKKENFSVHEKTFTNLLTQLFIISFWKEIIQENVCECTKICKIRKHFLSHMIPNNYIVLYCVHYYTWLKLQNSIPNYSKIVICLQDNIKTTFWNNKHMTIDGLVCFHSCRSCQIMKVFYKTCGGSGWH